MFPLRSSLGFTNESNSKRS